MKAILTSTGFENKKFEKIFIDLVGKDPKSVKVLFVPTAAVFVDAIAVLPKCMNDLLNAGILKDNIKVYDLHKRMLWDEIEIYDAIYFCGGDCNYLLERINEIEFNTTLQKFIENDKVFVGVSAGSIVAAKNLTDSLGYINCTLDVHCEEGSKVGKIDTDICPHICLTNNQAIVINDNNIEIIE